MPGMMFSGPDVSGIVFQEQFFKGVLSRIVFSGTALSRSDVSGTLVSNNFESVPGSIFRNQEFKKAFESKKFGYSELATH